MILRLGCGVVNGFLRYEADANSSRTRSLVLSQMQRSVTKWAADSQPRLRGDTQGLIDETDLADYISLSQPPDLTFSDHVHRLISTDRVYRASHRTKPEASGDPLLDESMVLLHDIV
jgi:hypothetical protein